MSDWIGPKDGGPAFPLVVDEERTPSIYLGMSLRDYFAAQALSVLNYSNILSQCMTVEDCKKQILNCAAMSYRLADAMLAERQK